MRKILLLSLFIISCLGSTIAQEKLESKGEIPILAWYSIPANQTTVERYREMKEAGITYSLSFFSNLAELQKALDVASKVGVKIVASCPEMKTDPDKTIKALMNHPALAGYHLTDEPPYQKLKELGEWGTKIQSIDNKHFCYVNLFPNFADTVKQLGIGSYRKYVFDCDKLIPLKFLSFDYYPVMKDRLMKTWYENLEQFSEEAKKANKPFWAFALTTTYDDNHVHPQTLAAMRLQVYSDLAYGAQGIQYFTYWSATSVNTPSGEDQRGAPISVAGTRSAVYDRVKQMSQEIKNLSGVFYGAKMLWVRHFGKAMIPQGTIRLTTLPEQIKVLDTGGAPALVSLLGNGPNTFMVVINKDFVNTINLTVYGDETVKKVLKDGTIVPASAYDATIELDPGDAAIYMYATKK